MAVEPILTGIGRARPKRRTVVFGRLRHDKWGSDTAEPRCQNWGEATPGLDPDSLVLGTVARQVRLRFRLLPSSSDSFKVCLVFIVEEKKQKATETNTQELYSGNVSPLWSHLITSCCRTQLHILDSSGTQTIYHQFMLWSKNEWKYLETMHRDSTNCKMLMDHHDFQLHGTEKKRLAEPS